MAKKKRYHNSSKSAVGVMSHGQDAYPYMAGSWLTFDKSAMAGMPRNVVMKEAEGENGYGLDVYVPGSKNYMDMVQEQDHRVLKKIMKPSQV